MTPLRISPDRPRALRLIFRKYAGLLKALAFLGSYGSWILLSKMLILSLIAYFLQSGSASPVKFEEINDSVLSSQLSLLGIAALAFVALVISVQPVSLNERWPWLSNDAFSPDRVENRFLPSFFGGAMLAGGLVLAFILLGQYQSIGFYIPFEELPGTLLSIALRTAGLGALVYCEEFIFRYKIARYLQSPQRDARNELLTAVLVALGYCAIRDLQFDLGISQLATAFLLSLALSLRRNRTGDFTRGAGFLAGLVIVFQPVLSLPILGSDFSGLLLVKPRPGMEGLSRILTGGAAGPFSSFTFQVILVLDIIRNSQERLNHDLTPDHPYGTD